MTDTAARLDALFGGWPADAPGGALTLLRGGAVVHERQFGLANLEHGVQVAPDTRFHIASVTKTFVGAACALLHHQGRLDLDADIRAIIPELRPESPLSLRHLLAMTSGLRDSMESMALRGIWYRYPRSSADLLDLIFAQTTQCWPTAQRWVYTNINFNLAALAIERVTGQAFDAFLRETFWQPLGMNSTLLRDSNTQTVAGLADAYIPVGDTWQKGSWAFGLSGAGGLVSSVPDLMRWHGMFREGGLHGAPLVELMSQRGTLTCGERPHYGLGLMVRPYRGATVLHHSGGLPGYKAMFAHVPEHDFGMVLLTNRDDTDTGGLLRRIVDICLDAELAEPTPEARGAAARPSLSVSLDGLDGRYLDPVSGEVVTLAVDAGEGVLKLEKLGTTLTFRPDGGDRFVDLWAHFPARLRIVPLPAGRAELHLAFGGQRGVFAPVVPHIPADMATCLGRYRNAEMRSEVEVFLRGGIAMLRLGPAFHREAELPLEPVAPGIYQARQERPGANALYAVRFQHHAGMVEAVLISSDRLKDARFVLI
jgi:D-aminopeptidase